MEGKTPPAQVPQCQDHLGHKYRTDMKLVYWIENLTLLVMIANTVSVVIIIGANMQHIIYNICSIFNIQYYLSAPCAMHIRTDCLTQHYTEAKDWSDVRYNRNLSAIGGNQL